MERSMLNVLESATYANDWVTRNFGETVTHEMRTELVLAFLDIAAEAHYCESDQVSVQLGDF